jgi:hypothetical protein
VRRAVQQGTRPYLHGVQLLQAVRFIFAHDTGGDVGSDGGWGKRCVAAPPNSPIRITPRVTATGTIFYTVCLLALPLEVIGPARLTGT